MTSFHFRRSLLAAVSTAALLLVSAAPAWADDNDDDEADSSLVFKAGVTISELLTPGNASCNAIGVITGIGQATQLGPITLASSDCIKFTSQTSFSFSTLKDTKVILTANDGMVYATYKGTATPYPGNVLVLTGTFTFKGGTGRYAKASGTGTLDGVENISTAPATGVLVLTGKIKL